MEYDWTIFFDEFAEDFHPTFQKELSRQLFEKGEVGTGIKQFKKHNFQLMIGMDDLKKWVAENKVYARVSFITPTSFSFPVNIYWYSESCPNLLDLHRQDITSLDVIFGWADNFPIQQILPHIKPYRIDKKVKTGLHFEVEYYYYLIPDISLEFQYLTPLDEDELKRVDTFLSAFCTSWNEKNSKKQLQFISGLTERQGNTYQVLIDTGTAKNIKAITNFLASYSDNFEHLQTLKISIR